jgi:hypothetical protein
LRETWLKAKRDAEEQKEYIKSKLLDLALYADKLGFDAREKQFNNLQKIDAESSFHRETDKVENEIVSIIKQLHDYEQSGILSRYRDICGGLSALLRSSLENNWGGFFDYQSLEMENFYREIVNFAKRICELEASQQAQGTETHTGQVQVHVAQTPDELLICLDSFFRELKTGKLLNEELAKNPAADKAGVQQALVVKCVLGVKEVITNILRANPGWSAPPHADTKIDYLQNVRIWCVEHRKKQDPASGQKKDAGTYAVKSNPAIEKGNNWVFYFGGKTVSVDGKLKGLKLLEFLLTHPDKNYNSLELLKEVGLENQSATASELIYEQGDRRLISFNIKDLEIAYENEQDPAKKAELKEQIDDAKNVMRKATNKFGKSRGISDKYRIRVDSLIKTVLERIGLDHSQLYNHFNAFLKSGVNNCYKPDEKIVWDIK